MTTRHREPAKELTDDHRMELTNLVIELDALQRIFGEAARKGSCCPRRWGRPTMTSPPC